MRYWKCPKCKRVRDWEKELVMRVCYTCQIEMKEVNDEQLKRGLC